MAKMIEVVLHGITCEFAGDDDDNLEVSGTFTVQVTVTDKDGGVSATVQQSITVSAVDLQSGTLVIGGTSGDDSITIAPLDVA